MYEKVCTTCEQLQDFRTHFPRGGGNQCNICVAKAKVAYEEWETSQREEWAEFYRARKVAWDKARDEELSKLRAEWELRFQQTRQEKFPSQVSQPRSELAKQRAEYQRRFYMKHPEKRAEYQRRHYAKKYGVPR